MGIGFTVFGLLILAFGLFVCYAKKAQLKDAETVSATITGFLEKKQRSKYVVETLFCPVAEYEKNGRKISAEHHEYFRSISLRHSKGDTVLIYVHPQMPKKFYFVDEGTGPDLKGVAISAVGAAFMILGIIALAIS